MLAQQEKWCKIGIICDFRADVDGLQKQQKMESLAETFDLQRPELLHAANTCVHPDVTFAKHTRVNPHQSNHESGSAVPLRYQAKETPGLPALSLPPKLQRFLRDLGITGPSGEHLPYWDQISYTRFLFYFW